MHHDEKAVVAVTSFQILLSIAYISKTIYHDILIEGNQMIWLTVLCHLSFFHVMLIKHQARFSTDYSVYLQYIQMFLKY